MRELITVALFSCIRVDAATLNAATSQASLPSSAPPDSNMNSDTSASAAPSNHTAVVVASVIGVLFFVAVCVGALYYMKWRRLRKHLQLEMSYAKSSEPSIASFVAGYSAPESRANKGEYTYYMPPAPSLTTGGTRSASPSLSVSTSFLSIPRSIYEPSIAESYSPAAASSALYTTNLEYSPLAESVERAMSEDQRIAIQKRWHLTPVRRAEE